MTCYAVQCAALVARCRESLLLPDGVLCSWQYDVSVMSLTAACEKGTADRQAGR